MRPKIWLVQWGKSTSSRCPAKVVRDLCGTNLFKLTIDRHLRYIDPDRVVATVQEGPQDDFLAQWAEHDLGIEVFRNQNNGPLHMNLEMANHFRMADDDIQINISPDVPFVYLEDVQYRIDALIDSDKDFTESLPEKFPCRDWEWACCDKRVWKAGTSRKIETAAVDSYGSQARLGDARLFWAMLIETGLHRPLIVEKPTPAKECWCWQPLWIDEPEHFRQAEMIVEALGEEGLKDRSIRKLLDDRPLLAQMTANAPRSTIKIFHEYKRGVDALKRVVDRDGFVPQWRGWEDG